MAKERSAIADYGVYVVVRFAVCLLQAVSLESGWLLARGLACLAYHVDKRHRNVAIDNLRHAFPNRWTDAELQTIVRQVYQHFALLLVEILHLPRKLHPNNWHRYAHLGNGRQIVEALLSGSPVLVVTGHYGNWEMAGYALAMFGFKSYAIARPLDNPYLDDFLRRFRMKTGQQLIAKKGDFDRLEGIMRNGGIVCTLGDQDAGQKGLFVDFFGRPASTHKAIALLAIEHHAATLVSVARRLDKPLHYEIRGEDLILPNQLAEPWVSVRSLTERFTLALERLVRTDVRQYLWLHRRWKHQPRPKLRQAA